MPRKSGRERSGDDGSPGRDPMEALRRAIDEIDRQMVSLLNRRARHAVDLGQIKNERNLPIYQPDREKDVLANVRLSNDGPLEHAVLQRLFERIIDESRRLERLASSTPDRSVRRTGRAARPVRDDDRSD